MLNDKRKVVILSVISALFIWVADAALDAFWFHQGSFGGLLLFDISGHELYFRLLFVVSFLLFGLLISMILSKRRAVDEILRKHRAAMEASIDGMAILDSNQRYVYLNAAHAEVYGYDRPEELIGKTWRELYHDGEISRFEHDIFPELLSKGQWRGEAIGKRKDGSLYRQEVSLATIVEGGIVCVVRDITVQKLGEKALHRSERFLGTIFDSIRDPFCIFDRQFMIIKVNEAYARMKNRTVSELQGKLCFELLDRREVCDDCVVQKTFTSADPCAKEKPVTLVDGSGIWVEIYTYPIIDVEGRVSHVIEYTRDITDRKRSEEEKKQLIVELEHLSRTDSLTGLLNRRALEERLDFEINRARRYRSEFSLILCDVDDFKKINDAYGHHAGDRVLQTLSEILFSVVRKADIVGRYGGDEFMFILPETSLEGGKSLAEKIRLSAEVTEFGLLEGQPTKISLSLGLACLDMVNDNIDALLRRADKALYVAKQAGKNMVHVM